MISTCLKKHHIVVETQQEDKHIGVSGSSGTNVTRKLVKSIIQPNHNEPESVSISNFARRIVCHFPPLKNKAFLRSSNTKTWFLIGAIALIFLITKSSAEDSSSAMMTGLKKVHEKSVAETTMDSNIIEMFERNAYGRLRGIAPVLVKHSDTDRVQKIKLKGSVRGLPRKGDPGLMTSESDFDLNAGENKEEAKAVRQNVGTRHLHGTSIKDESLAQPLSDYNFHPRLDSAGGDIGRMNGTLEDFAVACRKHPKCVAFNDNGWLKSSLRDYSKWNEWTGDPTMGIYTKKACYDFNTIEEWPCMERAQLNMCSTSDQSFMKFDCKKTCGICSEEYHKSVSKVLKSFDFYPRMDSHGGDIVGRKVDGPLEFIAEVCRKNSECVAFNDNGWVKGILKDSSSWEEWTEDFSKGLYVKKACIDRDLYDSCGEKVRKNECNTSNPRFMAEDCAKSCDMCPKEPTSSPNKTSKVPSEAPSALLSDSPTGNPSNQPTLFPSAIPSDAPSQGPSEAPDSAPSAVPSDSPTGNPSKQPTLSPSAIPSNAPSQGPSEAPSSAPSAVPSDSPTSNPSKQPTLSPSAIPSGAPSQGPSEAPSSVPSAVLSDSPTSIPSKQPTLSPSAIPSNTPSQGPSFTPSHSSPTPLRWAQVGQDLDGNDTWDRSGWSVALSGDGTSVAIGAPETNLFQGRVRIFQLQSGNDWVQVGQDIFGKPSKPHEGEWFGWSVKISDNGFRVAILTVYGATRIYDLKVDGHWAQVGEDIPSGSRIDLSLDGSTFAIGAPYNDDNGINSGLVRIFVEQVNDGADSQWDQVGQDIVGEAPHDRSGTSFKLSGDGSTVAIGAPYNDGNGTDSGHVRIFKLREDDRRWIKLGQDLDGDAIGDHYGSSIALSGDGSRVAIKARYNGGNVAGHIKIFQYQRDDETNVYDGRWIQVGQDIGGIDGSFALTMDGHRVAFPIYRHFEGSWGTYPYISEVRIYELQNDDSIWVQVGKGVLDGYNSSGDTISFSQDGSTIAIGAPDHEKSLRTR